MSTKAIPGATQAPTMYSILFSISLVHLLNDTLQAVIPAVLPILQLNLSLSYFQLGIILLVLNVTASVFQPVIGYISDAKPRPALLPLGMLCSGLGMVCIGLAGNFALVLLAVALVGLGSAVFHPEASRVAYLASGNRRGLGQSIFQVGGNAGQALAPLMSILIFVPFGQHSASWFFVPAAIALFILTYIALWSSGHSRKRAKSGRFIELNHRDKRYLALFFLVVFVSVRSWVFAGFQSFYPLYLIDEYAMEIDYAQVYVFLFLLTGALGTFLGGPIADRFGKRNLLIFSMLGALPLALLVPYVQGFWAYPLMALIGLILLSSFSVAVVYAQELLPGKIGTVSGLITGLAFGMGGIGASALGYMADIQGLHFIMVLCSLLPLVGFLGFLLPKDSLLTRWEDEAKAAASQA